MLCTGITIVPRSRSSLRHVLRKYHLHPEQRIADAELDAERVERLRFHIGKT
jgi:hypothetical protein